LICAFEVCEHPGTTVTVPSGSGLFARLTSRSPKGDVDLRLDRCCRYVRELHAAEERDQMLIRPSASVNDFLSLTW
jgi:hypothetical protein